MNSYNQVLGGLITGLTTIMSARFYDIDGRLLLPTLSEGASADSQVIATIKQNGSTVYTSNAGDRGFHFKLNCAANDVISVALASGAAIDQIPNTIKCTVAIG